MGKARRVLTVFAALSVMFLMSACGGGGAPAVESVALRAESAELEKTDLLEALKVSHLNLPGEEISGGLKNQFEAVILGDTKVVNDHSTGLMWQQDEETTRFTWKEAEAYVAKMNADKFAGFADWRLPTAEELASLLTSRKKGDYFLDALFHKELLNTWTSDQAKGMLGGAWFVDFSEGRLVDGNRLAGMGHVRLVRTR